MIYRNKLTFLALIALFCISCRQEKPQIACPAVICETDHVNLKIQFIDQNKGTDLLANRFAPQDVRIHSTRFNRSVDFDIDSLDKVNKYLIFTTSVTDEFIIQLNHSKSDTLSVETKFTNKACCGILEIANLSLNKQSTPLTVLNSPIIIINK